MSASGSTSTLSLSDLREWLEALGLTLAPEDDTPLKEQLRDGILLCHLVNKIRPGSVESVSRDFIMTGQFRTCHWQCAGVVCMLLMGPCWV